MRIALIQFIHYECLGVMYLSASLKKHGHDVEAFIWPGGRRTAAFASEIAKWRPDIAAFSVLSGAENTAVSIAREIKACMPVYTVFGGPHPTMVPEMIESEGVDSVCRGEGERSLVDIADALAFGDRLQALPGVWHKVAGEIIRSDIAPLEEDLAALPRPDRALYRSKYRTLRSGRFGFISGRGCPYQCTFCSNPALMKLYSGNGRYVRRRAVADVIGEIRAVMRDYDVKTIFFEDDTFILNGDWVREFCDMYRINIGVPFSCHIRADLASEEMVSALAGANCRTVSFGVETGHSERRRDLLKKEITDDHIIACADLLKKYGIRFRTLNMLGLPGETIEESLETVALNAKIKPDFPWCGLFQPLPGTALWEYCRENGLIDAKTSSAGPTFFKDSPIVLKDKQEIQNLQKLFYYAVKLPELQAMILRAIRMKPASALEPLFLLAHAWMYLRSERITLGDLLNIGFRNIRRYLPADGESRGSIPHRP